MSSEVAPPLSTCGLCSVNCRIGAQVDERGQVRTVFPRDLGLDRGACVLGVTAGKLLRSANRIHKASIRGADVSVTEAATRVWHALEHHSAARTVFVLDVARPLEGIAAAAALGHGRLALFVPPEDEPFARAGVGPRPAIEELADCDMVLTIADPFSTHPPTSRYIRDMRENARGNRFIAVDTAPSRCGRSADRAIALHPHALAGFLCAMAIECGCPELQEALGGVGAEELCERLGLPILMVRDCVTELREAKAPAIVMANRCGQYAHADAAVLAAARLAGCVDAKFFPMTVAGNSLLAPALAHRFEAVTMASLLTSIDAGQVGALVLVGVDPTAICPERIWRALRDKVEFLACAGPLHTAFARTADVSLPLALPWEESGSLFGADGAIEPCNAWLPPPAGVPTTVELMAMLAAPNASEPQALDGLKCGGGEPASVTDEVLRLPQTEDGQMVLSAMAEPYGYTGALCIDAAHWQARMGAQERVSVPAAVAEALELHDGDLVALGRADVTATLPCTVRGESGSLPAHRRELRELLDWRVDAERITVDPAVVQISKVAAEVPE